MGLFTTTMTIAANNMPITAITMVFIVIFLLITVFDTTFTIRYITGANTPNKMTRFMM